MAGKGKGGVGMIVGFKHEELLEIAEIIEYASIHQQDDKKSDHWHKISQTIQLMARMGKEQG